MPPSPPPHSFRPIRRIITRDMSFLLLSAVVNVCVAWGFALEYVPDETWLVESKGVSSEAFWARHAQHD